MSQQNFNYLGNYNLIFDFRAPFSAGMNISISISISIRFGMAAKFASLQRPFTEVRASSRTRTTNVLSTMFLKYFFYDDSKRRSWEDLLSHGTLNKNVLPTS